MNKEFKPCPFCGRKPILRRRGVGCNNDNHTEEWEISCPNCGAIPSNKRYYSEFYIKFDDEIVYIKNGKQEAIEAWQRRFEPQHCGEKASVAIIDELIGGEADVKGGQE